MAVAPQRPVGDARRRLGALALFVAVAVAALVASHQAAWPFAADRGDHYHYRPASRAQADRCLTARGLRVIPAGARSLRVSGAPHLDVILTFHATVEQAQAIAAHWQSTPYAAQRTLQRNAFDNVTVRASSPLDDDKARLLGGCLTLGA